MSYTTSEVTEFTGTITLDYERRRNALNGLIRAHLQPAIQR